MNVFEKILLGPGFEWKILCTELKNDYIHKSEVIDHSSRMLYRPISVPYVSPRDFTDDWGYYKNLVNLGGMSYPRELHYGLTYPKQLLIFFSEFIRTR